MSVTQSESQSLKSRLCSALAVFLVTFSVSAMAQNAAPDAAPKADIDAERNATPEATDKSDAADSDRPSGKLMIDEAEMSPGMHLAFDGSSTQAFEKSMADIRSETTEAEFVTVQHAIDYLLVYDLAARRDPEVLYKRLDGKTPAEMLKLVNWQTGKRGTRSR